MKKSLTIISLLAGAVAVHAQGTWQLSAYSGGASVLIYAPQVATPTVETMGAGPNDRHPGATVYTGTPIGGGSTGSGPTAYGNGANYTIAIYAAPGADNTAGLAAAEAGGTANAIITSQFETSGGTGSVNAGTGGAGNDSSGMYAYNYGVTTVTAFPSGFAAGTAATIQILAWYSGGGNTYASDSTGNLLPFGSSAIGEIGSMGGGTFTSGNLNTAGITSFSLMENVPEPSTIALGVIGASTLLFRRRK